MLLIYNMIENILEAGETLARSDRYTSDSNDLLRKLAVELAVIDFRRSQDGAVPLVEGEEGQSYASDALDKISVPYTPSELEAWLQAEIVAAGIAAAHQMETSEPVSEERQQALREALTDFVLKTY